MDNSISVEELPAYPLDTVREAIKKRINELIYRGKNLNEIAREAGVSRSTIEKAFLKEEGGTKDVNYQTLCKVLSVLRYPQLSGIKVDEIMSRPVICIHEGDTVMDSIRLMIDHNYSQLPVLDQYEQLVGEFTVDTVRRLFLKYSIEEIVDKENPLRISKETMDNPPPVFPPGSSLAEIWDILKYRYYILVGETRGKPIGIITRRDPLYVLYRQLKGKLSEKNVGREKS